MSTSGLNQVSRRKSGPNKNRNHQEGVRVCTNCEEAKPIAEFAWRSKGRRHSWCKACKDEYRRSYYRNNTEKFVEGELRRRYGLTIEERDVMARRQKNLCAICKRKRPLHVDHDHETGIVRGLLCFHCNSAIGKFDDDPVLLLRAMEYVCRPQG